MAKKVKVKVKKEEIVFDPSNEAARLAHIKRKLEKRAKKRAEREAKEKEEEDN